MNRRSIRIALALITSIAPFSARAQNSIENGKLRVELIGLKRWTIPMIQDSLAKYAPHDSLLTHSCAEILRDALKFADASVNIFPKGQLGLTKDLVVVALIEPQDSALIRYRPAFADSLPQRKDWVDAWNVVNTHNMAFQRAIQTPGFLAMNEDSLRANGSLGEAIPLQKFLNSHKRESDRRLAVRTLAHDGNARNRIVAVAILQAFSDNDETWWTLLETLRDPDGRVGSTAGQAPQRNDRVGST